MTRQSQSNYLLIRRSVGTFLLVCAGSGMVVSAVTGAAALALRRPPARPLKRAA